MQTNFTLLLSRRQTLLAGATLSVAMAMPAFARTNSSPAKTKGMSTMHDFIETKDRTRIFYKACGSGSRAQI
jgi:non-heme chloroperoxidase